MAGEIASIQVLEDSGGGLHMACFNAAGDVTNFFSGLERLPAGTMEREVVAAMTGGVDGWDNGADDAQAAYDNLTSRRHRWPWWPSTTVVGLRTTQKIWGTPQRNGRALRLATSRSWITNVVS